MLGAARGRLVEKVDAAAPGNIYIYKSLDIYIYIYMYIYMYIYCDYPCAPGPLWRGDARRGA